MTEETSGRVRERVRDRKDLRTDVPMMSAQGVVNFTNILSKAFKQTDPKSAKNTITLIFCAFWICAYVKAALKSFTHAFLYESL